MSDFGTMQARIAREVRFAATTTASGLGVEIRQAINDAVADYDQNRFEFNEALWEAIAEVGRSVYPLPDEFLLVDTFRLTLNGSSYTLLERQHWDWIDRVDTPTSNQGYPAYYAIYAKQFRLYPSPQEAFPMRVSGVAALTPAPLVNDTDTNAWMVEGERLVRARAKEILYRDVLHSPEKADIAATVASQQFTELRQHANEFVATGSIAPSW